MPNTLVSAMYLISISAPILPISISSITVYLSILIYSLQQPSCCHFKDEKTEAKGSLGFAKVTQLVSGEDGMPV